MERGIVYVRGRCDGALLRLLGVDKLPVLARQSRLAKLIMWEAHLEDHRSTHTDVLARSRRRAWIVRGVTSQRRCASLAPGVSLVGGNCQNN